ncbi:MAG TPA: M14 family zinc carboxypeptidase, partial [Anaerolineales bacterium]|nr:M14 family zinc carboxypeptidase [Anaerolineales bacterium]
MKRNILSLLVLVSMLLSLASSVSAASFSQSTQPADLSPSGNVVARIYFTSQDELNDLASRYDIAQVDHEQGFALVVLSTEAYIELQQAGYRLELDNSKTKLLNQPLQALPGQGPDSIPGYLCYRTVEETYTDMQEIAVNHPDMAELIDIGNSWDKFTPGGNPGYDILALRLSNENFGVMHSKPTFFMMAEIHAREYTTAETAMRYAEYLINNYGIDPDVTWLLDYYRVYIVTMTNPDGRKIAETGDWWRKNVDNNDGCNDPGNWGTDLNRNHSFHWSGGG